MEEASRDTRRGGCFGTQIDLRQATPGKFNPFPACRYRHRAHATMRLLSPRIGRSSVPRGRSEQCNRNKIDEDGLVRRVRALVPANPGRQIVDAKSSEHHQPFEPAKATFGPLGKDFSAFFIERLAHARRIDGFGLEEVQRNRLLLPIEGAFAGIPQDIASLGPCFARSHAPEP